MYKEENPSPDLDEILVAESRSVTDKEPLLPADGTGTHTRETIPPVASPSTVGTARTSLSDSLSSVPILERGYILGGRYEILQILGQGGMGAVYKAHDRAVDRVVALKVIRPELAGNPAIVQRFKQELSLARRVTHRNVIRIYDLGEAEGLKFITMELIEGVDLRSMLAQRRKLSPAEAVDVMQQVCLALDAAHSAGVIHRDLKPQNIICDRSGRAVVLDFGLARSLEGEGMTQTGTLLGTIEYMAPEQALGTELDQRSDLYTVGLIFYEVLTGQAPYKADSPLATLLKRTQERATPISDLDRTIPLSLSNVVNKCLECNPKLRYGTAKELLADLGRLHGKDHDAGSRFHDIRLWAQGAWHWIGVIAVVLILSLAGFLLGRKGFNNRPPQKAAVTPSVSMAILPFRNTSGDTSLNWLGPGLADILRTDVGQSASLRMVSPGRLQQVLLDLRVAPNASLDSATLQRLLEYTSADTVVWGEYAKFDGQIRIEATFHDLKNRRTVPLRIERVANKDVARAVDRFAESIRQNLAVSPNVLKELKATSFQPSSTSLLALRDYSQGAQLLRTGRNLEAIKSLQAAIKEDPQFALAYSQLAEANAAVGNDNEAEQNSQKAMDLSQQLPLTEKYLIEANHARFVRDNERAVQAYENLNKSMPDNGEIKYALGSLYMDQGDYRKARPLFSRILQAEPENLKALWQMGSVEIMSDNPQGALDPLNRGMTLAIQTDNQEQKALILLALGVAYRLLNKPEEALQHYAESMTINEKLGQKRAVAAALNEVAQVQEIMGKPDTAIASYRRSLQLRREIGAKKEVGNTLIDMANLHQARGQYDRALHNFKESLLIQRESGDQNYEALCLTGIGGVYLSKNDVENALTYLQQALQLREKLMVEGDIAESLATLADVYIVSGQYDQALASAMRALDLWRKGGNARGVAAESYQIGLVFRQQGRLGAALSALQDAVKGFRQLGDRSGQMVGFLNDLADTLSEAGRGAESGKLLEEARGIARDLKNESVHAQLLNTDGDIRFYGGDLKAAESLYSQALHSAIQGTDRGQVLISKLHLAKVAIAEGHARSAVDGLRAISQQADGLRLKYLSLESSVDLAQAMMNSGDYTHARQQLETDLTKTEKAGMRLLTAKIHYLLGNTLRLRDKGDEAATHYREALYLLDGVRREPGAQKVLERADLKSMHESTLWSPPPKN